jgi:uncharacterized phage protein gp47/JayE
MSVSIDGSNFGVLATGFKRPTRTEILAQKRSDAIAQFGPHIDLSAASPMGRWLAAEAEREDALWTELEALYYAGYIPTAAGDALSLKAGELGIYRRSAGYACGVVTFRGREDTDIPVGTRLQANSGALFETQEAAIIPAWGRVDVAIQAVEAGSEGNVASGTIITLVTGISGVDSVANGYDPGTTLLFGQNDYGSISLAADGVKNDYQLVSVSDIAHPHRIDEISVRVRNDVEPTPFTAQYNFHVELVDHDTGEILGRTETQTFSLDVAEERDLLFTNQAIDIHEITGDYLRVAFVNEASSAAALGLAYDGQDQYQRGALYLNTVEQASYDAIMYLVSSLPGSTSSGTDGETDPELRLRYRYTAATFGSATAEAIRSQVYRVEGVHSVTVEQNRSNEVVDGMNPHSVTVTVYGGDPDEIGEALLGSVPAGCETLGSSAVIVPDSIGQTHVFNFNKATRVDTYIDASLTVDSSFSHDTAITALKDALIAYIGGEDSEGTFYVGLPPGEDVVYQKLIAIAMGITGITDITLTVGEGADPTGTSNLDIAITEVAETKTSLITVEVTA